MNRRITGPMVMVAIFFGFLILTLGGGSIAWVVAQFGGPANPRLYPGAPPLAMQGAPSPQAGLSPADQTYAPRGRVPRQAITLDLKLDQVDQMIPLPQNILLEIAKTPVTRTTSSVYITNRGCVEYYDTEGAYIDRNCYGDTGQTANPPYKKLRYVKATYASPGDITIRFIFCPAMELDWRAGWFGLSVKRSPEAPCGYQE